MGTTVCACLSGLAAQDSIGERTSVGCPKNLDPDAGRRFRVRTSAAPRSHGVIEEIGLGKLLRVFERLGDQRCVRHAGACYQTRPICGYGDLQLSKELQALARPCAAARHN